MNPQRTLAQINAFASAQIVRQLSDGPTSNNYLVARDTERFVLRLDKPLARKSGLDRAGEAVILRHVAAQDLGPELVFSDPEKGILMTRFIAGENWQVTDLHNAERLKSLARLLRRLHALAPVGPMIDYGKVVERYAAMTSSAAGQAAARDARKVLRELNRESGQHCLCHHDVNVGNIIGLTAPKLIDWEYAAPGDPLFDLAVVIEHHALSAAQAKILLEDYQDTDPVDTSRLAGFKRLYRSLNALWQAAVANER